MSTNTKRKAKVKKMKYQYKLGNSYFHCFFSEAFGEIFKGEYYWEVRIENGKVKCFSVYKELLKEFEGNIK